MPRPPVDQPLLSRSSILEAALAIVDEHGMSKLSMRRLASELGVAPGSLYRWFPHQGALVQGVFDKALDTFVLPSAAEEDWRDGLRGLTQTFRQLWQRHPTLIPHLFGRGPVTEVELALRDQMHRLMKQAGVPEDRITVALLILPTFWFGLLTAMERGEFGGKRIGAANKMVEASPERYPHLSVIPVPSDDELYEAAVALIESCVVGLQGPTPPK